MAAHPAAAAPRRGWLALGLLACAGALCAVVASGTVASGSRRCAAAATALLVVLLAGYTVDLLLLRYARGCDALDGSIATSTRRGLRGALVGADGRASTSKAQVVLWTAAVLAALVQELLLTRALPSGASFASALGTSWHPEYLVLLGLPAAAATVASVAVSRSNDGFGPVDQATAELAVTAQTTPVPGGQLQGGQVPLDLARARRVYVRRPALSRDSSTLETLAQLVTQDDGVVSWPELQYVAFNLLAVVFFVVSMVAASGSGLPQIPDALLTLMGVSASAYAANKVAETRGSAVTASTPAPAP